MLTIQMAKSKASEVFQSNSMLMEQFSYGAIGALSALATIGGEVSPFGVAWAAAIPSRFGLMGGLGAAIGYLFSPKAQFNVQYVAAVILALSFKWAINILPNKIAASFYPLIGGVAIAITASLVNLSEGMSPYSIMMVMAQTIIAIGSGYIFQVSIAAIKRKTITRTETIAIGAILVVLSSGLCSVTIGSLSVGRVALMLLTMLGAYSGGVAGGAIAGCISALAASLLGQQQLNFGFTIGGLLAGVFSQIGRIPTAAILSITLVLGLQLTGGAANIVGTAIESTMAGVIFLLIPKSLYKKYNSVFGLSPIPTGVLGIATSKLSRTAAALAEVAQLTTLVNRRIEGARGEDIDRVYSSTADIVCRRCPHSPKCWQTSFNDTMAAFNHIIAIVKSGGTPRCEDLPSEFLEHCTRPEQIVDKLSTFMVSYISRQGVKQQLSSIRTVITDQFQGMSMLLEASCDDINQINEQSPHLTGRVGEYFSNIGATPIWQSCYNDTSDTSSIMVKLPPHKVARVDLGRSAIELGQIIGEELDTPKVEQHEGFTLLSYTAKPAYSLEFAALQSAADGGKLCGDSYNNFKEGAMGCIVLSDGMGIGGAAAVDATMTTSLISRLVSAGVGFDAALRLVNGALLVKSGEERLATVDCCYVDLYTGRTDFYKAGAVPTFILRGGRVTTVSSSSLPAGILGGVEFAKTTLNLSPGDIIVMVSDGIVDSGYEWLPSQISSLANIPLDKICENILATAKSRHFSAHEDDMTVIAARVVDAL